METKPNDREEEAAARRALASAYLDLWEAHGAYAVGPQSDGPVPLVSTATETRRERG
ncbi:MAG: hypothetical protein AAFN79_12880 [Pseudomonadota bacterium]